jgi:hypothetical protein
MGKPQHCLVRFSERNPVRPDLKIRFGYIIMVEAVGRTEFKNSSKTVFEKGQ